MGWGWVSMKGQTNKRMLQSKLQRALRNNMPDAERVLWSALRRRQIGDFRFRRQHPFGSYILDFVCLEAMLVIEVDGGQHVEGAKIDEARSAFLSNAGFRVLRFWDNDVLKNIEDVKESIWRALHTPPPSQPSP